MCASELARGAAVAGLRPGSPHPGASVADHETGSGRSEISGRSEQELRIWRSEYGRSCRLWSGQEHPRRLLLVEDGRWLAFSAAGAVDYNLALCHGPDPESVAETLEAALSLRRPAIVMLGGPALGSARTLADAGWVPIGAQPFMCCPLPARIEASGADVRLLDEGGVGSYRRIAAAVFGMDEEVAALALPEALVRRCGGGRCGGGPGGGAPGGGAPGGGGPGGAEGLAAYGLYSDGKLRSAVAVVRDGSSATLWSMATRPQEQGRGHGRRLLTSVLSGLAADGADHALLAASPAGERLYRQTGFTTVEHWQLWTRPRWVLA